MNRDFTHLPEAILSGEAAGWINPLKLPYPLIDGLSQLVVSDADIAGAKARFDRFAPFIAKCFPETAPDGGLIESPLRGIPKMREALIGEGADIPGRLYLKMDSHLAVAGSIKARGGFHEVLVHAEKLAIEAGILHPGDDYAHLAKHRDFFGRYTVQVGSTGNLGMSIGIMSAALGFRVRVHMSADAKAWKKALLRSRGVEVIEYDSDYSAAVAEGRRASDADPMSYFVDDEWSVNLFLGYAVAAGRLKAQLEEEGIKVDGEHPLIVYLPAGVGGAPGGITLGLKRLFGDAVHCFFAEPSECPSVTLGIATQLFEAANVRNFGLSGKTDADGLACASPSGLVTRLMTNLVSGSFTAADADLYSNLRLLHETEGIFIEPSSCAAFMGPRGLMKCSDTLAYAERAIPHAEQAVHIVWATGGRMVPEEIRREYLNH